MAVVINNVNLLHTNCLQLPLKLHFQTNTCAAILAIWQPTSVQV